MNLFNPAGVAPTYDGLGATVVQPLNGGTYTATVAAGAGSAAIVNVATAGRFCRVLVTAAGTGTGFVTFFDNGTGASGTVIGLIPATVAEGTMYVFDLPVADGIWCVNVANGPALTVSYA